MVSVGRDGTRLCLTGGKHTETPQTSKALTYPEVPLIAFLASSTIVSAEPMKPEFHYTVFIAKPAAEVWSALTEKKTNDCYYMAPLHTLVLKEGGGISYGGDAEFIVGVIETLDAPKSWCTPSSFPARTIPRPAFPTRSRRLVRRCARSRFPTRDFKRRISPSPTSPGDGP